MYGFPPIAVSKTGSHTNSSQKKKTKMTLPQLVGVNSHPEKSHNVSKKR